MARFIEDQRASTFWVSGSLDSLVPSTSPVRTLWAALTQLDFGAFDAAYKNDDEGRPAIEPRRLAGVWVLGLMRGVTSSIELESLCERDIEFRWLLGDAPLKKSTLCAFRTSHTDRLADLCAQLLAALGRAGMLPAANLAVDGTVIQAAASLRSVHSPQKLRRRIDSLRETIACKLEASQSSGNTSPAPDKHVERLFASLRELEALHAKGEKRITVTEPDAKLRKLKTGRFAPGYNVQVTTDLDSGVIVHAEVVMSQNDQGQLSPQIEAAEQAIRRAHGDDTRRIENIAADSAYHHGTQLGQLEERDVACYVSADRTDNRLAKGVTEDFAANKFTYDEQTNTMTCPAGQTLRFRKQSNEKTSNVYEAKKRVCQQCPHKVNCCPGTKAGRSVNRPVNALLLENVAKRLDTPTGIALKKARQITAEGTFARFKGPLAWTRCRTWGLNGARAELLWRQLTSNLCLFTKLWKPMTATC